MTGKSLPAPVKVNLGERSHSIYIGENLLTQLSTLIDENIQDVSSCVFISSSPIYDLYGENLLDQLSKYKTGKIIVPDGEAAKSWKIAEQLLGQYIDHDLDRKSLIIALGGGSVGDLAGFTASIYLRGIRLVQIPTTLLGQVDSGIGGKTAVNHLKGKNLIGTFHQPSLVVCDTSVIKSLKTRDLHAGLAEVVKYGVISDESIINLLENKRKKILKADKFLLNEIVKKCVMLKAKLVEKDENDSKGKRAILNYGHTIGHCLETLSNHEINHGEAISIGMIVASKIAENLGYLKYNDLERQRNLLKSYYLPTETPKIDNHQLLNIIKRDKKAVSNIINFILPTGIGKSPILKPVPENLILKALEE